MSSVDLATIKDAIHAWVVEGSGLPEKQVFYVGQNIVRPDPNPFIAIRITGIEPVASDWNEEDENEDSEDGDGEEIIVRTRGHRAVTMTITAFSEKNADDASEANALLLDVIAHAGRQSIALALSEAGIGMMNFGSIAPLDGFRNSTRFDPRAFVTIVFDALSEVTETNTNIVDVNVEVETTNPAKDYTFNVDISDT